MMLAVRDVADPGALPLLDGVPFQSGGGWWRAVATAAIPAGCRPVFRTVERDGRAILLMPLLQGPGAGPGAATRALVTPYTCLYQPVAACAADLEPAGEVLARSLGPVVRLDAMDPDWDGWAPLLRGFRRAGYRAAPFAAFGNWVEPLGGRGWDAYLADRPGALRETVRRRLRRAERDPAMTFALAGPGEAATFLMEYERVHAGSWKQPEPFPAFAAAFIAEAERAGVLRIAVLRRDGNPVAAQYWTVEHGIATVLKLAHAETARTDSPGTVLTAWVLRRLIDVEGVAALDFGRGDDPYKGHWATQRRQRSGVILADPRQLSGAAALVRQAAGHLARRLPPAGRQLFSLRR